MKGLFFSKRSRERFLTSTVAIIVGVTAGALWSYYPFAFAQQNTKSEIREIRIHVKKQANPPVLISAQSSISTDAYKPSYEFLITNVSQKPVRAFTIQTDIIYGNEGARVSRSHLSHLISEDLILRPNQSRQHAEPGTGHYPEMVKEIILSIDFVEFDDGTSWGDDVYKSAENLAGQRTGGKIAARYFREKLEKGELNREDVESKALEVYQQVDPKASPVWKRGFEKGIGIVRNRVLAAYESADFEEIKRELEKPFDASSGRRKP